MSHIVTIQTEIRDPAAIRAACRRLQLPEPVYGTTNIFSGTVTGWAVELPGWRYPVVCDVPGRQLHFDDYQGRWGDRKHLHRFLQAYSAEKCQLESRRQGYACSEETLDDGSIQLTVHLGDSP